MEAFAQTLTTRPMEKLVDDILPLAQLSEWKFLVARSALRKRLDTEPFDRRQQLETAVMNISETAGSDVLRIRIRSLIGK